MRYNTLGRTRLKVSELCFSVMTFGTQRKAVPLLKDQGVDLLVWSPLAGGLLAGKFTREDKDPSGR